MQKYNNYLRHYGVLGMKWGRRKNIVEKVRAKPNNQANINKNSNSEKLNTKKMSDDELQSKIRRLEMEQKYKELINKTSTSKGKTIVKSILESSAKNIGSQLVTYAMGKAINSIAGAEVVNPKKGQKDK